VHEVRRDSPISERGKRGRTTGGARLQARCARLKDGREVRIRPASPADLDALRAFFAALSPQTLRLRFLFPLRELPESMLRAFIRTDDRTRVAFVAEPRGAAAAEPAGLIAEARYIRIGDSDSAELALVVADGWRRVGLGTLLMRALLQHARNAGVRRLCGDALAENTPILGLVGSFGARITVHLGSNTVQLCLESSSYRGDSSP
jgi:GNAT superfamily N-acetyltransferase